MKWKDRRNYVWRKGYDTLSTLLCGRPNSSSAEIGRRVDQYSRKETLSEETWSIGLASDLSRLRCRRLWANSTSRFGP